MTKIGEISEREEFIVEWSIENFISLPVEVDAVYESPVFSFINASWCLNIYPNGQKSQKSERFIDLYLRRVSSGNPITVDCTLGIKSLGGKLDLRMLQFTYVYRKIESYGYPQFLSRTPALLTATLIVVCKMKLPRFTEFPNDVILCQDFKKMLLYGKNHDLILKVGNKELRAHRDVLRARSQVFESMLNHDTIEKKTGVIDIPDCDLQAMELFLSYVYSGKVETLDQTNMLGLYYISDKYNMGDLKYKCCNFIKNSLSYTNICDVIKLALAHSDTNLLEYATEYFMDNTVDIMLTVEWQNFLKDNTTVGNELLIKSFRKVKDSKN